MISQVVLLWIFLTRNIFSNINDETDISILLAFSDFHLCSSELLTIVFLTSLRRFMRPLESIPQMWKYIVEKSLFTLIQRFAIESYKKLKNFIAFMLQIANLCSTELKFGI